MPRILYMLFAHFHKDATKLLYYLHLSEEEIKIQRGKKLLWNHMAGIQI